MQKHVSGNKINRLRAIFCFTLFKKLVIIASIKHKDIFMYNVNFISLEGVLKIHKIGESMESLSEGEINILTMLQRENQFVTEEDINKHELIEGKDFLVVDVQSDIKKNLDMALQLLDNAKQEIRYSNNDVSKIVEIRTMIKQLKQEI